MLPYAPRVFNSICFQDETDEMKEKIKMISQQLEQQKEYVAYKEVQLTKNDTGKPGAGGRTVTTRGVC